MTTKHAGRREDQRLLTGAGRYSADFNLPGQLYAAFLRADRGHAVIRSIDKSAAEASPGVVAVYIGRDVAEFGLRTVPPMMPFPGRGGQKLLVPDRPLLARDRVRYVGEEVAMVIARSAAEAADAAELVEVDYEELPVVIGFDRRWRRRRRRCTTTFRAMSASISNMAMRRRRMRLLRGPRMW